MSIELAGKIREFVISTIYVKRFQLAEDYMENDKYVNEKFGEMQQIMDHSPVCLINMLFMLTMRIHTQIDRKKLDTSSYDKFMASVRVELDRIMPSAENLAPAFGHTCAGPKKAPPLKPGEQMFYAKYE